MMMIMLMMMILRMLLMLMMMRIMMRMITTFTFLLGAPMSLSMYSRENQIMQIVSVIASSGLSFEIIMIFIIIMLVLFVLVLSISIVFVSDLPFVFYEEQG